MSFFRCSSRVSGEFLDKAIDDLFAGEFASSFPLILLGDGVDPELFAKLARRRQSVPFTLHAVVARESAGQDPRNLVEESEGIFKPISEAAGYGPALLEVYASVVHCYGIAWSDKGSQIEIQVNTPTARTALTC